MQVNNRDPLFAAVNKNVALTSLSVGRVTLQPATRHLELWKEVEKIESKEGVDAVVSLLANSHLGYLVYELVGKQTASIPIQQERARHAEAADTIEGQRLQLIISELHKFQQDYHK
jgi:hypothetical protein